MVETMNANSAPKALPRLTIDTIRTLAIDAAQKANSGHPGTPMGFVSVAHEKPDWPNRDRFVLSIGHASMLLYAVLHLAGVREIDADGNPTNAPAVSLDDIKAFRQLDSKTPGHPTLIAALPTRLGRA